MDLNVLLMAALGGLVPMLLWLWLWLREDAKNPEPKEAILKAFLAGGVAVGLALLFEKFTKAWIEQSILIATSQKAVVIILTWAVIEETLKFAMAYFSSLRKKYNNEPIDALIYMIVVAIGFAAFENVLYLLFPLGSEGFSIEIIQNNNYRFIGAALLHILASSAVGVALSFTYYKRHLRKFVIPVSLAVAILIHYAFNYALAILDINIISVSAFVWIGLVALLIIFERIKRIKR